MKNLCLLSIFICTFFYQIKAQETWTLERCIEHALSHNIELKMKETSTKISNNTLNASRADLLPSVNAFGTQTYTFGRSVDPYTNDFSEENVRSNNFWVQGELTLFQGFSKQNTIAQNKFNFLASLQNFEKAKNDLTLNIVTVYLQILYNEDLLQIAENQLAITKMELEKSQVMVEAGKLAKGGLLEVKSQAAHEALAITEARNRLELSKLTLIQMLELEDVENFAIVKPEFNIDDNKLSVQPATQIFEESVSIMPEIKSAEYNVKSYEKNLAAAYGQTSPVLDLFGTYSTGYSDARTQFDISGEGTAYTSGYFTEGGSPVYYIAYPTKNYSFSDQVKDNASKSLSFRLTIPIFNGLQRKHAISNAKLNLIDAQQNLELSKNILFKEIQQAHADAEAAYLSYQMNLSAQEAAKEAFEYTQEKYQVGLISPIEYSTSKNKLILAESELLQSKYTFIFKTKVLDFYKGKSLKL